MNILVFRYNISFIDPERGVFGEIFPEVMIFPEGFSPRVMPDGFLLKSVVMLISKEISRAEHKYICRGAGAMGAAGAALPFSHSDRIILPP